MRQRTSGQAMVELALVLPLFLFILLGFIDFGRVVFAHTAITQNAEAAARFASVSAMRDRVEIEDEAMLISPGVPYDRPNINNGTDTFYPNGIDGDGIAVVEIEVDVPIITPFVSQMVGGAVTVNARAEERLH